MLGIGLVLLGETSRAEKEQKDEEEEHVGRYEQVDEHSERSSGFTELESPSSPPVPTESVSSRSTASATIPLSPMMLSPRRGELKTTSFHNHNHNHGRDNNGVNNGDNDGDNDGYDWRGPHLKRFNSTREAPAITTTTTHHHRSHGLSQLALPSSREEKGDQGNQGEYRYYYHAGSIPDEIATV